jgi:hypothetical protein
LADEVKVFDWKKQQVPILMSLSGALLVAFDYTTIGFLLVVLALVYAGVRGDASMKDKNAW